MGVKPARGNWRHLLSATPSAVPTYRGIIGGKPAGEEKGERERTVCGDLLQEQSER